MEREGARPEGRIVRVLERASQIVVGRYDGAIKAEHGSGRNMAPFVLTEWGQSAYDVMRRVKDLLDPHGIWAWDPRTRRPRS